VANLLTHENIFVKQTRFRGFRFRKEGDIFIVERWGGDGWFPVKTFDTAENRPDDWLIALREALAAGVTAEDVKYILDQVA
jgi:hypothetical protein